MPQHKMAVINGVRYRPEDAPAAETTSAEHQGRGSGQASSPSRRRRPTRREPADSEETSE